MQAFEVNHQYYTGTGAHILVTKRTAKTATVTQYGVTKRCKKEEHHGKDNSNENSGRNQKDPQG